MNMKDIMIPFTGYGDFALYQSLSEAKSIIKANATVFPDSDQSSVLKKRRR